MGISSDSKANEGRKKAGDSKSQDKISYDDPMSDNRLFELEGYTTDWSNENSEKALKRQRLYSKNVLMEQQDGPPDISSVDLS